MKIFGGIYDKVMAWSAHRHAPYYLGGLSFAESSFFPIPPDVMLAPMALAKPKDAWFFALITTLTSVAGGVFGYFIGLFAFEMIEPILHDMNYWERYQLAQSWFVEYGFWAVFLAGFSPIPYKVFTIASGVIAMAFLPFVLASLVGRGLRFFLVAGLMAWGGERMEKGLRKYIDIIGWGFVVLAVVGYFLLKG